MLLLLLLLLLLLRLPQKYRCPLTPVPTHGPVELSGWAMVAWPGSTKAHNKKTFIKREKVRGSVKKTTQGTPRRRFSRAAAAGSGRRQSAGSSGGRSQLQLARAARRLGD